MFYIKKLYPAPSDKVKLYKGSPGAGWHGNTMNTGWQPVDDSFYPKIIKALNETVERGQFTTPNEIGEGVYRYSLITKEETAMILFQPIPLAT